MDKTFNPSDIEQACYKAWEDKGYFKASGHGDPYCILLHLFQFIQIHVCASRQRYRIRIFNSHYCLWPNNAWNYEPNIARFWAGCIIFPVLGVLLDNNN